MKTFIKIILLALSLTMASSVFAQEFDAASQLKSLFTTPLERHKLDAFRDSGKFNKSQQHPISQIPRTPLKIDVRGIVIREAGQPVVWINDGNTLKSEKIDDSVRVRSEYIRKEPVIIPVRVADKTLKMKPGQHWDEQSDKIQDKYLIKEEKSKPSGMVE